MPRSESRLRPVPAAPPARESRSPRADVQVRPLDERDQAAVIRLDGFHTGQPKPRYWQRLWTAFVGVHDDRHVALAAERAGRLVGFVFAEIRALEFGSEPCGWILEIAVDASSLRQGVASALLREACRQLRAAGVVTIRTMVRRNAVPVLTFFRTNGFSGGPYVQLELTEDFDSEK